MKILRWLVLLIILVVFILPIFGIELVPREMIPTVPLSSFDQTIFKLSNIDQKYGLGENKLAPGDPNELASYKMDLQTLNSDLMGKSDPDSQAAKLILNIKMDLVDMETAKVKAMTYTKGTGITNNDCSSGSLMMLARENFEIVKNKGDKILENRSKFFKDYESYAPKVGWSASDGFDGSVQSVVSLAEGYGKTLSDRCNAP